ncbi:MAG: hypothetical protein P0Y55_11365 [Candidatus Cohnella colombiensis]|uniref:Uncharacterized protein n=1 Tax=Candidatus Cohnella colombiensis TaxID=3121368 RepID=A0AA95ETM6_9BACL|nr:MAG: hypothetical protein P0Y55_11365 [Cohnella sp.]
MEKDPLNMGDVYQMMTYVLVIILSAIIMTIWLKRKAKRKRR